jgi:hypothetical protein
MSTTLNIQRQCVDYVSGHASANLDNSLKLAIVEGAVTGGGPTVIANAPNPAGQALLGRFFGGTVQPLYLLAGAVIPTLVAAAAFRVI